MFSSILRQKDTNEGMNLPARLNLSGGGQQSAGKLNISSTSGIENTTSSSSSFMHHSINNGNSNKVLDVNSMVEKMEHLLQDSETKREYFEKELVGIRDEIKQIVDTIFDEISKGISSFAEETDSITETCVRDFKKSMQRKKEMDLLQERLSPVFELLQQEKQQLHHA